MSRIKRILSVVIAAAIIMGVAGCANSKTEESKTESAETGAITTTAQQSNAAEESDTITVTDFGENTVTVKKNIERIVVADIYPLVSVLSVFFDSAEKLVGIAPPCMSAAKSSILSELYPEILTAETGFIDGTNINMEELLKLSPDVVFYSADSPAIGEQLANAGIAGIAISASMWEYNAIETLNQWLLLLGQLFPGNDKSNIVKEYSESKYNLIQERVLGLSDEERARVFFLFKYTDTMITTSGTRFFGEWWANAIGAINVAGEIDNDNALQVNMEQVYAWNPQIIYITNFNAAQVSDICENTIGSYDWSGIDAVKNKQVYKMPLGMYRTYTCGVDTPITLLWLAKTAYPELFADIDMTAEIQSYYKDVFGIELTTEQAEKIFVPLSSAGTGF